LTPKNNVRIAHLTKNRVRFVCERIGEDCDESRLEAQISEFRYAKSVRVNKKAKSIIVGFESNLNEIKEFIENLPIANLNKRKNSPSKAEIYKAATALAITPLINNNGVKAMASLIAAAPLLKEGASEAVNEGITSKVLEATAVGVSLARRDFLAANSTNLMLTIGEYMEESAVHRSDDLIKELARPNIEEVWIEINDHGKKSLKKIATVDVKIGDIVVVGTGESTASSSAQRIAIASRAAFR